MIEEPSALEILFLWHLATAGGGEWKKEIKPDIKGPLRKRLVEDGFIEEEKRKPEGSKRKLLYVSLTDRGWKWLSEHLDAPLETRSPVAVGILMRFLAKLQDHLNAKELTL